MFFEVFSFSINFNYIIMALSSPALRASYVELVISTLDSTNLDLFWVQRNNFSLSFFSWKCLKSCDDLSEPIGMVFLEHDTKMHVACLVIRHEDVWGWKACRDATRLCRKNKDKKPYCCLDCLQQNASKVAQFFLSERIVYLLQKGVQWWPNFHAGWMVEEADRTKS